MSLKDTTKHLRTLLQAVCSDLDKAENGNKAASQRVRTGTIKLEKIAKLFRKESIKSERTGGASKKKKAPAPSKAPSKAPAKKGAAAAPAKKGGAKKAKAKPKSLSKKRPTAKILKKK